MSCPPIRLTMLAVDAFVSSVLRSMPYDWKRLSIEPASALAIVMLGAPWVVAPGSVVACERNMFIAGFEVETWEVVVVAAAACFLSTATAVLLALFCARVGLGAFGADDVLSVLPMSAGMSTVIL